MGTRLAAGGYEDLGGRYRTRGLARRQFILAIALLAMLAAVFAQPAMPQDPMYHRFADGRSVLGIPNGLNVLSSLPFLLVGATGCGVAPGNRRRATPEAGWPAWPYLALFLGTTLTTFGSVYYHLAPPIRAWSGTGRRWPSASWGCWAR